jgi:hypothetical protein
LYLPPSNSSSFSRQAQAAEVMLGYDNNCLHLDGTKKRFTEYGGFQISTEAGSFSLSHKVMPSGDADSYLQEIFFGYVVILFKILKTFKSCCGHIRQNV